MEDKKIFVKASPDHSVAAEDICRVGIYNFIDRADG